MNIKQELLNGLRDIREELGTQVLIEYEGRNRGVVPAVVYNQEFDLTAGGNIVLKKGLRVNILKQDLIDRELPTKGFKNIKWNFQDYVPKVNPLSSWGQVIVLDCSIVG